jgi:DNA-binding CsgD family transcriptional regulator
MGYGSVASGRDGLGLSVMDKLFAWAFPLSGRLTPGWRRAVFLLWAAIAAAITFGVVYAVVWSETAVDRDWVGLAMFIGVCATAAALTVLRGALIERERLPWILIGISILLVLGKDVAWYFVNFRSDSPLAFSVHDVIRLALVVPGTLGLVLLIRARFNATRAMVFDAVAAALVFPALFLALTFAEVFGDTGSTPFEHFSWAFDPVAKVLVLCALLAVCAQLSWRPSRTWALLLAAVSFSFLGDLVSAEESATRVVDAGSVVLWTLGMVLPAAAAWQFPPRTRDLPVLRPRSLAAPALFAVLALVYLVIDQPLGNPLALSVIVGAGLLLSVLRVWILQHQLRGRPPAAQEPGEPAAAPPEPVQPPAGPNLSALTPRELEVVELIGAGWMQKQAASELGVSQKTVEKHLASARRKLGVRTSGELIVLLNNPARARARSP